MQITLNQNEVQGILAAHAANMLPHIEPEDVTSIHINEDGTAMVIIGEEVVVDDAVPVVAEKPKRTRGPNKKNAAEAKHVPVEAKEALTSTGGQNESSTSEPEAQVEKDVATGTEAIQEEATDEAEEAAVQEEVQEKAVEAPATTKPSLFANLKR